MSATRASEKRAETVIDNEREAAAVDDDIERPEQLEQLYMDVLYTVANTVGAPAPGGQVRVCAMKYSGYAECAGFGRVSCRPGCTYRNEKHTIMSRVFEYLQCTRTVNNYTYDSERAPHTN